MRTEKPSTRSTYWPGATSTTSALPRAKWNSSAPFHSPRLTTRGWNALAPDLYKGRVTQKPDEANHLMTGLDFPGATHQDIRGAAQRLGQGGAKVAVMGFCMGGALTVAAAVHVPEAAAGVCFYGIPPKDFADPAKIKIPFQGHFADRDDWCTPQAANELEAALKKAGASFEIHRYEANHGFFNEQSEANYDAKSANLAWARMTTFLKARLG